MRTDTYTKAVLTVIAIMLTVLAGKTLFSPSTTASAQGVFAGVQFDASGSYTFFGARSGEVWQHGVSGSRYLGAMVRKWRTTKLGQPLILEYEGK